MQNILNLRSGNWVEVRPLHEILATLDSQGALEGVIFMPEMAKYCGARLQVYKRADKTCDTVAKSGLRRMENTVHLTDVRCDGLAHCGCEASCLIFWKEAWLRRVQRDTVNFPDGGSTTNTSEQASGGPIRSEAELLRTIYVSGESSSEPIYRCQATNLREGSSPLPWWDLRQYVRDLLSGNVGLRQFIKGWAIATFNGIQRWRRGRTLPFDFIGSQTSTPTMRLDLAVGELVQVRNKEEILATLSKNNKNRGLWFDAEMLAFCGGTYRVKKRVTRIVNERTGKILNLPGDCLILEGVFCKADYNLFCPRSIYSYWREIWLRRVNEPGDHHSGSSCHGISAACGAEGPRSMPGESEKIRA
jgi:hypothetical protein